MSTRAGTARRTGPESLSASIRTFLAAVTGDARPATMDEAIDALLDGPPRPRADLAGAAVALGRAVDVAGGLGIMPRGGPAVVLVTVPSADWVAAVAAVAWAYLSRGAWKRGGGMREANEPVVLEGDGTSSTHRPDKRNDDVTETLNLGGVVVGVSQDPIGLLPCALVRGAETRIAVAAPDPDDVALVVGAVTGEPTEERLPGGLAALCDPTDLTLAVHAARGAEASHARLAAILGAKAGTRPAGPGLEDLAGYGAAREWGLALVADLRAWTAGGPGAPRWRDLESAILLSGPPGVGKTTFAAALARSAGLPLHAGSLGQWQAARDGHLGHTLGAMRLFFERARRAPCVVLIDEIDGFGDRTRYAEENRDYATQVCNALLEHLDGSAGREGVVVVGATNHPDRLDPAIVRSGRLDRHVRIGLPGPDDLAAMLALHLGGAIPASDLPTLVARMGGMTGADVEGLVRKARGIARRDGRAVAIADLAAVLAPPPWSMPPEARRRVSVHEAGHALAAWASGGADVTELSIDADGGSARMNSREALGLETEATMEAHLTVMLAGRAAEEILLGDVTAGSQRDLIAATHLAVGMETRFGFSRRTPLLVLEGFESRELPCHPAIEAAVHDRLSEAYDRALGLMRGRRRALTHLSDALEREGRLDGVGIRRILGACRGGMAADRAGDASAKRALGKRA